MSKKKVAKAFYLCKEQPVSKQKSLAAFSFGIIGAKEKANKKKSAEEKFRRVRAARRAARPPPARAFEKARPKLFRKSLCEHSGERGAFFAEKFEKMIDKGIFLCYIINRI